MIKKHDILFFLLSAFTVSLGMAQEVEKLAYKQIDTVQLMLEVYRPATMTSSKKYPAMVFFFGGGWKGGSTKQFEPQAQYFAQRGIVCFLADYRVESRQGTTPFESLMDAKSAIRYIRANAEKFQVDSDKVIAAGGSAGGHLAAATALIEGYSESTDDLSISAIPDALVLFNPVIDNGPGGYGHERIGDAYKTFSPLHNIKQGAPPTLLFLGTKDHLIPVETSRYYNIVMEKVGSRCDLHLFEGESHGFFNYSKFENYKETVSLADDFLQSLGYLEVHPKIKIQ
ncbi:MAG: alpha/beta hydrolase [Maribacter sp.]